MHVAISPPLQLNDDVINPCKWGPFKYNIYTCRHIANKWLNSMIELWVWSAAGNTCVIFVCLFIIFPARPSATHIANATVCGMLKLIGAK